MWDQTFEQAAYHQSMPINFSGHILLSLVFTTPTAIENELEGVN